MVSPDTSAESEEGTSLSVPEHATRLHLRWEKKEIVSFSPVTDSPPGKGSVMLPTGLQQMMEDNGFGNLDFLTEEEIPELGKRITERLKIARRNLGELQTRQMKQGPDRSFPLMHSIGEEKDRIEQLTEIKLEFERWRPKTL